MDFCCYIMHYALNLIRNICDVKSRDCDFRKPQRAYNRFVLPVNGMNVLVKSFQALQDDISRKNETAQAADSIKALASIADVLVRTLLANWLSGHQ